MKDYRIDEYDLVDNHVNYAANRIENIQESLFSAINLIIECSDNNGIEGLNYIDVEKIKECNETLGRIKYLYDLFKCIVNDYRESVDNLFYNDIETLLKSLSGIKNEDITVDNDLGIMEESTSNKEGEIRKYKKNKISFVDILNYGDVSKIMQKQYNSLKDVDYSFEQYIEQLAKSGEIQYASDLEKFISVGIDLIPIIGDIKGLIEAVIGKDIITNQDLSDLERGLSALSAIPGFGDAMDITKEGAKVFLKQLISNVALFGASCVGSAACEELGVGRKGYLAILLLATVGVKNREQIINVIKNGDYRKIINDIDDVDVDLKNKTFEKFYEIASGEKWNTIETQKEFIETFDMYAERAVIEGACSSKYEFYLMYLKRNYIYTEAYINKIKGPYLQSGASSLINQDAIENAFDEYGTIGRGRDGNFTTSCAEDNKLCFENGKLKNHDKIAQIKGVDTNTYKSGIYQYEYDSQFVRSCNEAGLIKTPNGNTGGASSLNIPGCKTWAGSDIMNSESELMMPSIKVDGIDSEDVFKQIQEKGYFEIVNPTVITADGKEVVVKGSFKINKLGG